MTDNESEKVDLYLKEAHSLFTFVSGARERLDDKIAIEIADNIRRVGFADYEAGFSNNPYLLVAGDEAGVARV